MAAYMEYITEAAKAIRNSLKSRASDRQIEQDVDNLRKFEFELSKVEKRNKTTLLTSFKKSDCII